MKIVNIGKPTAPEIHRMICSKCNSELEYYKTDIRYGEETRDSPYIVCPVCETWNSIYREIK